MRWLGTSFQGKASVIWWAIHSAVGLVVTLSDISLRRWCLRTTNTKSNLMPIVGRIRKSMAAMPAAGLRRKVFPVCDRPRPLFAMYLARLTERSRFPSLAARHGCAGRPKAGWPSSSPESGGASLLEPVADRHVNATSSASTAGHPSDATGRQSPAG